MKQDVTEYVVGSFIDFKGEEHKIVACALSQTPETSNSGESLCIGWADGSYIDNDNADYAQICRVLTIGISICHPTDTFDLEKGKKNAYQKALNNPSCPTIYAKNKGVINTKLVKAFLEQEINFIKENPERVIKGYNEAKVRFEKKQAIKTELANLTDKEKFFLELAKEVDVKKCLKLLNEQA